ncbi:MAG: hypothetical protein R2854_30125 [Caldilineaceae bacterium]
MADERSISGQPITAQARTPTARFRARPSPRNAASTMRCAPIPG